MPRSPSTARSLLLLALGLTGCKQSPPPPPPAQPQAVQASPGLSAGALPALKVPHIARGAITVDGKLDEAAWASAGTTGAFVGPLDGRPHPNSRVNATARMLWDDDTLYVAFVVADPDPTSPFSPTDEDPHLWERASAVELMIQPGDFGDNANYFEIQVDTKGSVWDTAFDNYNQPVQRQPDGSTRFGHQEWKSQLRSAAVVDPAAGHYTLEIAIPFAAFQPSRAPTPPRPGDTWRFNLYSFRDGQRDALAWSPTLGRGNFHIASRFGKVTFAP